MKRKLIKFISYLIISCLVAFVIYLAKRLFPWFSQILDGLAVNLNTTLNLNFNVHLLSFIIAFFAFVILYLVLMAIKNSFKNDLTYVGDNIDPYSKSRNTTFLIFKFLFSIIFIPLIIAYGLVLINILSNLTLENNKFLIFALGFVLFGFIWIVFHKKLSFLSIFEHEFTHMVLGLLFLHKPKSFYVKENSGGWVTLAGSNFVITLGPYFFLTFCFFLMPLYLIIKPDFYKFYFLILGILASYHTFSTIRETRFNSQPDIIYTGKIFSFLVIILGNILNYGILLSFVLNGFTGVNTYLKNGWNIIWKNLVSI